MDARLKPSPAKPHRRQCLATVATVVATVLVALAATAAGPAAAQQKRVAVSAIVEHPALDAARDGVRDELKDAGFEIGKNLRFDYQSAQGNTGTAAQIARKFVGDRPDVIVAIATPSAQAVVAATKDVPVVFTAVTDPVAAKLVPGWEASGTNVTGVSDMSPLARQIELMREIVPNLKRIGVVFNPGEANSVVIVEELKKLLPAAGLTLVEGAAPRTVDVPAATQSLVGKVDVIYAPTDNNVMSAFEGITKVSQQAKLPVVAADTSAVPRGATAALGLSYYDLGRQTGKIVVRILNGEKPGAIPPERGASFETHVNPAAAKRQGVTLPESLLKNAKIVEK